MIRFNHFFNSWQYYDWDYMRWEFCDAAHCRFLVDNGCRILQIAPGFCMDFAK